MSETISPKNVKYEEIDLLDLFKRLGNGIGKMFKALGRGTLVSIVYLIKHWLPLSISILMGLGISFGFKILSPSYYSSEMILRNNAVPVAEMINYVNRLHTFCDEDNKEALTSALSLNLQSIENILDIRGHWIIDKNKDEVPDVVDYRDRHDVYDTINIMMQDRFNIRVKIKAPQELGTLKTSILRYIHSDSLFQQRNRLRLKQNNEFLTRLEYDILQLDSLQKVKYFEETRNKQPQTGGQMIFLQEQETQLVYPDIHTLYAGKQKLEQDSEIYFDLVTILSDFSIPAKRENNTLFYANRFIPSLFLLTLIILIILTNMDRIKITFEKY